MPSESLIDNSGHSDFFEWLRTLQTLGFVIEGSLDDYGCQIDAIIASRTGEVPGVSLNAVSRYVSERNQLYRCLLALAEVGGALTCHEIQSATGEAGGIVRHNNANKVLKRVPELARRIEAAGSLVRYEVQGPGRAYVRLMQDHIASRSPGTV